MVQFTYRFEKVLTVREQEKKQTEAVYNEAVRDFEKVATQLYELLKKKEELINYQNERLQEGLTIDEIHHYGKFIDSLEHAIEDMQKKVNQARAKMQWYEQKLVEKNLEVRKYEKMREKDFSAFQEEQNRKEAQYLDEISSLMYNKKTI
ncbi:MAG: flagellar export protein FliJ [Bacilli bacterium]|uniref:flagellar export protein FliJ n=1 Tax=Ureibacillus sp. FSL W7-1570 TaxID=2954593 RepID=UPI001EC34DE9|nr:flagellar export protein FliJ [Bacilli bacterium]